MARYFTHAQATQLLPKVERHLRDALFAFHEQRTAEDEFSNVQRQIQMAGGSRLDRDKVTRIVARKQAAATVLRQELEAIGGLGVQVKDLEIGLIDFPAIYQGEEVLLCWKLGEEKIEFWHGVSEGFRGRKPIDKEFLDLHQGEPEH
ncbi:MAG: DUF2203 family protein [Acidobacteria bacterium]|nr:DUF2203 family protein [Acidobacteriota bacterium]